MELTKRYIYAVTSCLPEKQRVEVAKELRSSIEDMAQDKAGGKEPTEKHIRAVLEELGDPIVVAQQYQETGRYLIGPGLYDVYVQVFKRILGVGIPIYTIIFAVLYNYEFPLNVGNFITAYGGGLVNVALHTLFWVTALFFVIDRTGMKVDGINRREAWTVDSLPELPAESKLSRMDVVASMAYYTFVVVGGAVLMQLIGSGSNSHIATFLNPNLTEFWLPLVIVLGAAGFVVEAFKLFAKAWSTGLVAATIAINTLFTVYMVALAVSQDVFNPSLHEQTREIAVWSFGITVVTFIFYYIYESYNVIKAARLNK